MTALTEDMLSIGGVATRVLRGGPERGEPVLFLHGGVPGHAPYCGSSDLWGTSLARFAADRPVVAIDLPGSGGTAVPPGDWLAIASFGRHVARVMQERQLGPCHLVGHDMGAMVALWLAMEQPSQLRSLSLVASPTAAPSGDGVENLALAHPPLPLWTRHSQAWAFDRLSYAHHHIDDALLDRCVVWASGVNHRAACAAVDSGAFHRTYLPSLAQAKARLYEQCRGPGIAVPTQIVWSTHDKLTTQEHGFALYRMIAAKQQAAHFHLINRAGSFPFREEPQAFHQIVAAFQDGLAAS